MIPIAAIIGAGRTKFGEHWNLSPEDIINEAGLAALESVDKGLGRRDIQAAYLGSFLYQITNKSGLMEGRLSRELGVDIPMVTVEGACASGALALYTACEAIRSGKYDVILVGGFEKMTDRQKKIVDNLMFAGDPREFDGGFNFPGLYATIMVRYMYEYGDDDSRCEEALAQIACKNHHHAINNPFAQYRREITVDDVFRSPVVAPPIRQLHCSPVSDGAAAVILTKPEIARNYTDTPIYIIGSQQATDHISLYTRESITEIRATRLAMMKLEAETGLSVKDIDIAELHDCFTIEENLAIEDIGFYKKGEGWKGIYQSYISFKGSKHIPYENNGKELFVNVGGGLKADGHPTGATGIRQVYEIFRQLRKEGKENQVDIEPNIALSHNIGGTGGIAVMHMFVRDLNE
jgi:acetyl-CoA C-acetyltransferase